MTALLLLMEPLHAIKILQSLAYGVDPHTGETFPHNSPYNHPQVIRALFVAIRTLEGIYISEKNKRNFPENAGKPWTPSEDAMLCQNFETGISIIQIAKEHKRTVGAIKARLVRLGKIEARHLANAAIAAKKHPL